MTLPKFCACPWPGKCEIDGKCSKGYPEDYGRPSTDEAYMGNICLRAQAAARKAITKFPQPNYVLTKIAEEAGEVVKAGVHFAEGRDFTWEDLEAECVQTIAMCLRLLLEGDGVIGIIPPHRRTVESKPTDIVDRLKRRIAPMVGPARGGAGGGETEHGMIRDAIAEIERLRLIIRAARDELECDGWETGKAILDEGCEDADGCAAVGPNDKRDGS